MTDRLHPTRCRPLAAIVAAALLLSGCAMFGPSNPPPPSSGQEARFAKPVAASQRIILNSNEVAGHRIQITDEDGPFWVNLSHNRTATAGIGNKLMVRDGAWRVNKAGQLCLKSSSWWKDGTCFELLGGSRFANATLIHSLSKDNGPNTYYPFTVLGPVN
jgi:hypothetical protein